MILKETGDERIFCGDARYDSPGFNAKYMTYYMQVPKSLTNANVTHKEHPKAFQAWLVVKFNVSHGTQYTYPHLSKFDSISISLSNSLPV